MQRKTEGKGLSGSGSYFVILHLFNRWIYTGKTNAERSGGESSEKNRLPIHLLLKNLY